MNKRVIGLVFFSESSITVNVYLDMLQLNAAPQLEEFQPHIVSQQGVTPSHWGLDVRQFLDETFQTDGSEGMGRHLGHLIRQTLTLLTFFFRVMSRTKFTAIVTESQNCLVLQLRTNALHNQHQTL